MDNKKSSLEICADLSIEELQDLSFTKISSGQGENATFVGLGILDKSGYLLDYQRLKEIYAGLNCFVRNVNPELIHKMNAQKSYEDQMQREKDQLIDVISRNIVDKTDVEEEYEEEEGVMDSIKKFFKRKNY